MTDDELAIPQATQQQRRWNSPFALGYVAVVPIVQAVGRAHGYAVAVHGSMASDLDLLAAPWTPDAADADTLIDALAEALNLYVAPESRECRYTAKPHGRRAYALHQKIDTDMELRAHDHHRGYSPYLDVSVMARG